MQMPAHFFDRIVRNEPLWIDSERNTELKKLVYTYFSLPIKHIPKPLSVHVYTTCKLRNADTTYNPGFFQK